MTFRLFIISLMAILAFYHIAVNSHPVSFTILWQTSTLPLSLITLFSMSFGALFGILYLSFVRSNQGKKRRFKELEKAHKEQNHPVVVQKADKNVK